MRLLKCSQGDGGLQLTSFSDGLTPPYAILSHTWEDGQEVTYDELLAGKGTHKAGYKKVRFCSERAVADGLEYFWVDTCCIDKSTSDELSTAINSMFRWYQGASRCYVYLSDVRVPDEIVNATDFPITWEHAFRQSRWFTRGWTLQELLAPATVEFFSENGKYLGTKVSLEQEIHGITTIPVAALRGQRLSDFSIVERMKWSSSRRTTLREDKIYCLLGIFGVFMPLIYGEGEQYATLRLSEEIKKRAKQHSPEKEIAIHLSWPGSVNHGTASYSHRLCVPQRVRPSGALTRSFKSRDSLLAFNSFFQKLGLYGSFVKQIDEDGGESGISFSFGICSLKTLRFLGSNSLEIIINRTMRDNKWSLGWILQAQHRVSADSPLMVACEKGDIPLMQQILEDKRGGINDQIAFSGRTPLMVAINGMHLEAVRFLLQHGANPNIPDDDQILPIFAAAGMNPRRNQHFEQLPPTWECWLDTFRLLISHGACPHEISRGRNLAGLNIAGHGGSSKVLPFLRLLAAEDALDHNYPAKESKWHALENAVKCGNDAVDALKLLHVCGVNTSRVLPNSHTALHLAAHHCQDDETLSYLLSTECALHINRQDQWGWTPLHYAVLARTSAAGPRPYSKAILLIRKGADPNIKGRENPGSSYHCYLEEFTGLELLENVRYARFKLLMKVFGSSGIKVGSSVDTDAFYDAEEYHS